MVTKETFYLLRHQSIFRLITLKEFETLIPFIDEIPFQKGDRVIEEGDKSQEIYFLAAGEVEVLKQGKDGKEYPVGTIKEGSFFGEMAFIDEGVRSSSVVAKSPLVVYQIRIDELDKEDPEQATLYNKIFEKVVQEHLDHIRLTNKSFVENLKEEKTNLEEQTKFGNFFVYMTVVLSIYNIILAKTPEGFLSSNYGMTLLFTLALLCTNVVMMKMMGYSLQQSGITRKNLAWNTTETALIVGYLGVSIYALLTILPLNFSFLQTHITTSLQELASFKSIVVLLYVFAFQWMKRGILQSSLEQFLGKNRDYLAIYALALLFVPFHLYLGLAFSIVKFSLDLFAGWLFYHQRNLIGVVTVHFLFMIFGGFAV